MSLLSTCPPMYGLEYDAATSFLAKSTAKGRGTARKRDFKKALLLSKLQLFLAGNWVSL